MLVPDFRLALAIAGICGIKHHVKLDLILSLSFPLSFPHSLSLFQKINTFLYSKLGYCVERDGGIGPCKGFSISSYMKWAVCAYMLDSHSSTLLNVLKYLVTVK